MAMYLFEAFSYLLLAGLVTMWSWRHSLRLAGAVLMLASALTSLSFFLVPDFVARIVLESVLASLIVTVAATIWAEGTAGRPVRIGPSSANPAQIIVILAAIDVALCAALCLQSSDSTEARRLFGWGTNLIFIGQCACVAIPGARDAMVAWIRGVDGHRLVDSPHPDFDHLLDKLDR